MKRTFSTLLLAGAFLMGISCAKNVVAVPEISFGNISSVNFDAAGGLGTAEIMGGVQG